MGDNFVVNGNRRYLHEGASQGRRLGSWGTRKATPSEEVIGDVETLRNRTRSLRRDNSWTGRGNKVHESNMIGIGVKPMPITDNLEFNASIIELWDYWSPLVDYSNTNMSIYTVQMMMERAKREAGESFLIIKRLRTDRLSDIPIPLQFQILEADYCPLTLNIPLSNGRTIVNGIELDTRGRVQAYYFFRTPPNMAMNRPLTPDLFVRLDRSDVIHYFDQERPNQLRGRPKVASSIVTSRTFDMYNDSEMVRKESRAALTGSIEKEAYPDQNYNYDPMTGNPLSEDINEVPQMELQAGTFHALLAGEKINLFDADDSGRGYKDYQTFQLLNIAASHGVPYQLLTGDWSGINDRVWRAIFNQYKREVVQDQNLILIPRLCNRIYVEFVKRAIVIGAVDVSGFKSKFEYLRVEHRTQAWDYIHPEQDVNSDIKRMQAGLASRSSIISKRGAHGETAQTIDAEREADLKREDELELRSLAHNSKLEDEPPVVEPQQGEPNVSE